MIKIQTSLNESLELFGAGDFVLGYRIVRVLGRGGFGTVYHAERETQSFALKVLNVDAYFGSADLAWKRSQREVQSLQTLKHPSVPRVFELGILPDGRPYLVMELLRGMDLGELLDTHGRLLPEEVLSIAEPLADVLDHAHAHGLLHRDIKPMNIFVDRFPMPGRVVLLDFGLVKVLDPAVPSLSVSGEFLGSPHFTAPEQVRGELLDALVDVYALGALLYTMLTHTAPFEDYSGDWEQAVLFSTPTKPSRLAPLPPAFDTLLLSALAADKRKRPASAGELIRQLREIVIHDR